MASFTDSYERELLDKILITDGNYLALFTSDPTDAGLVTGEVVGNGDYARIPLATYFTASSGTDGISANTSEIAFTQCAVDWGIVTHIGICKTGVKGTNDMILHGVLPIAIPCVIGYIFKYNVGDLSLTLS